MAIDESAGVLGRRDKIFTTSTQSRTVATLMRIGSEGTFLRTPRNTLRGLLNRGIIEQIGEVRPGWCRPFRLTAEGRRFAEASPAVKEWLDGWAQAKAH